MIRINLLPQKRAKKRAVVTSDPTSKQLMLGVGAIVAAAALAFVLVDMPRRSELSDLRGAQDKLQSEIAQKRATLTPTADENKDGKPDELSYDELIKANELAQQRARSIDKLLSATVVPAHVLRELGEILNRTGTLTITQDTERKIGPGGDMELQLDWDPTNVWLSGFTDTNGTFKLEGGAQTEDDVTELAKRLDASAHFEPGVPSVELVADQARAVNYFKFTISGKVVY